VSSYIALIRGRRAFRFLWMGECVTQLGDWLSYVAVSLLALSHGPGTGALAIAIVLVAHTLPHAILAPLSGIVSDRMDRRWLLLATHLGQALLTVAMMVSVDNLPVIQGLLFLRTSLSALDWPARTAAVTQVVPEEDLLLANTLCTTTWSMTFAFGMAAGGALALLGPVPALFLDALTFVAAAGLISRLPPLPAPGATSTSSGPLGHALLNRHVVRAVFAKTPVALAGGSALVLLNLVSTEAAFAGAAGLTLGCLQMVKGVGTGLGPLWMRRWARDGVGQDILWLGAIAISFAGIGLFTVSHRPLGWLIGAFVWGLGSGSNYVVATTTLQQHAPPTHLGRLAALDALSTTLGMSFAAVATGVLIDEMGMQATTIWPCMGLGMVLAAGLWTATSDRSRPRVLSPSEPTT
jgi:predicted MFS family arabinose efflux permease